MPTLVYDRVRVNTAVVTVYCRILTEYLAQYYDRISSPCRLRRDTTIFGYVTGFSCPLLVVVLFLSFSFVLSGGDLDE